MIDPADVIEMNGESWVYDEDTSALVRVTDLEPVLPRPIVEESEE